MTEFDVHQAGVGKKRRAESSGRRAETMCAWWLRLKGYRIVAERSRQPGGEIDLVAVRGSVLAFVEVKARAQRPGCSGIGFAAATGADHPGGAIVCRRPL